MKISASDIAKLGIPSLPTDRQGIEYHAKKNNWQHCFEQIGRGRPKKLYEIASLPAEIRAAIMKRQADEVAESMPKALPQIRQETAMSPQVLAEAAKRLNEKQRSVADARCAVVAAVLGIKYQYGCSAKVAVAQFLRLLAEGKLDEVTLGNLETANDRSRSAKVGERTLDGWISAYLKAETRRSGWLLWLRRRRRRLSRLRATVGCRCLCSFTIFRPRQNWRTATAGLCSGRKRKICRSMMCLI